MKHALVFVLLIVHSCAKKNAFPECAIPAVELHRPYSDPVWHPGGQLVGFNYSPLAGITKFGTAPCEWYMSNVNYDSLGFYILNRNQTGWRRVTNYKIDAPSWSPDAQWLAFCFGRQIFKIPFDGERFDTSRVIQLTDVGGNVCPSWTKNSDSIYFSSNIEAPPGTAFYSIWKMASDGSGKEKISHSTARGDDLEPFVADDDRIYFVSFADQNAEIFSMTKSGEDVIQQTFGGRDATRRNPRVFNHTLFYLDSGVNSTPVQAYKPQAIIGTGSEFDVSSNGEIVYPNGLFHVTDTRLGTLWMIMHDGTNNLQFTFNHY